MSSLRECGTRVCLWRLLGTSVWIISQKGGIMKVLAESRSQAIDNVARPQTM